MRAVALRSDEVVGVAGFLVPGSHLDVLATSIRTFRPILLRRSCCRMPWSWLPVISWNPTLGKTSDVTVVTLLLTRSRRSAPFWQATRARSTLSCATEQTAAEAETLR